jgi:Transcriptional regulatory protein, C terminal/AAA ATPase domain
MELQPVVSGFVGRDAELAVLERVLEVSGPRVCFVYGMAGIGKSMLLARFRLACQARGVRVLAVDCRSIEPTEQGLIDGLSSALGLPDPVSSIEDLQHLLADPTVVVLDTYEVFRIADPWLRHELLPVLGSSVHIVVAGREPPMLEWAVERGQLGGLDVLPLGPLDDDSVQVFLQSAGTCGVMAAQIAKLCCGHPLALRLAVEAHLAGGELPDANAIPRVVQALAAMFRDGLDEPTRRILDAAAVPRRITRGVLTAMLGDEADSALETLQGLALVEATPEGLRLHDSVHLAIVERLRAVDPDRFRKFRTAAWHHLQAETHGVAQRELARSTADLLFLIDNPVVREAMFPTTAHLHSVELCRQTDQAEVSWLWHEYDAPDAAAVLDLWLQRAPEAVRVIRDRSGVLVGCSIVSRWCDLPSSLEMDDPVLAAWAAHAARNPLPDGQTTIVLRRVLATLTGEGPSSAQAAAWLDVKRDYFSMGPHLGRVYVTLADPSPFVSALVVLGFKTFDPATIGPVTFHLAALDFGLTSVDGWLARLAAAELGIDERPFLDFEDRTVGLDGMRIRLSPLEFGVLRTLADRPGRPVTRIELLEKVWGSNYEGGSNVVDVVVRSLRKKLGSTSDRLETVHRIGYRLTHL